MSAFSINGRRIHIKETSSGFENRLTKPSTPCNTIPAGNCSAIRGSTILEIVRGHHHRIVGHEAIRLDFAGREYIGQHGAGDIKGLDTAAEDLKTQL